MHDIEPYYKWRDYYIASEDEKSPFYGRQYSEFKFSQKVYNYFIHPQWDNIGSPSLYIKLIFVHYKKSYAIIELIGEWNDCIHNDIMFLKREVADRLGKNDIHKFILLCDNVLNYHADDDCYYEEWYEDVRDSNGWVCLINAREHVVKEMNKIRLKDYIYYGKKWNDLLWQTLSPKDLFTLVEDKIK